MIKRVYSEFLKDWFHLIAFIIDDCNYNCSFCYNIKPRTYKSLNLQKLMIYIQNIHAKTHKNIFLEILGGEPTLHPDLVSFCLKINLTMPYVKIYIFTNFSQSYTYYKHLLQNNIALSITWHSKHDDITGMSFINKVHQIPLHYYDYPGIRLRILYEIYNIKQSLYAFDILYNRYKKYIEFDLLSDINNEQYVYDLDSINEFNKRSNLLKPPSQNDYIFEYEDGTKRFLKFIDIVKRANFSFKHWLCNAGQDCFYIHVDGNIYPCESYYFATQSNVFNGKINNLYNNINYIPSTKTLCKCIQCAWSWNIYKENVFNQKLYI